MLAIFVNVVLPVFIVAGLGFALERALRMPVLPVNQVVLYVLMPCFVFTALLGVDLTSEEPLRISAFAFLLAFAMLAAAAVIALVARLDRSTASAFMLTAAFPNLGNYGLPVVLLAFGDEALRSGTLLLGMQQVYGLALAVVIASSGHASPLAALRTVARQPIVYAVAAAIAVDLLHLSLPGFLMAALSLPAQAAIPVMLLVLGMNVAGAHHIAEPRLVSLGVVTRLLIGPLVGWGLASGLGIGGVARDVMIVGAAMPTAVFTILTATESGARPQLVSDVVVASTLASIVTITALLAILTGRLSLL